METLRRSFPGFSEESERGDAAFTQLGRTGLRVCRIGLGGGGGIDSGGIAYALSRGINYVFYASDLHAHFYERSRAAIRKYCRRGSRRRDEMVLVACYKILDAEKV
jgi:hypothetical protein